jgi:hypothetical protein
MARSISSHTIEAVKNVSVYDLAVRMGHQVKSAGSRSWVTYCPNPNHGYEKTPDTYIDKYKGNFICFGGGGCGCKGGDAITYYSWSQYGEWNQKYFLDCVIGIAEIMGIPVVYNDGSSIADEAMRPEIIKNTTPRPVITDVEPQPDDVCDRVYRRFLSLCPIYEEHVNEWRSKRQYSDEEIVAIGLRSIPREYSEINSIIKTLLSEGYNLERVPGFTQKLRRNGNPQNPKDWYWTIAAMGKYFIPVRNELGQIVRMRVSTGRPDRKYTWFSSGPNIEFEQDPAKMRKGGASSGAPLNIVGPYQVLQQWDPGVEITSYFRADFVVTTEGEHKSYISANRLKKIMIGMPGVGQYKEVIPTLKRWGTKKLAIAVDMDALLAKDKEGGKNKNVFEHLTEFAKQALEEEGIEVVIWCWDPQLGKGLDDLLLAGKLPIEIDLRTRERRPVHVA